MGALGQGDTESTPDLFHDYEVLWDHPYKGHFVSHFAALLGKSLSLAHPFAAHSGWGTLPSGAQGQHQTLDQDHLQYTYANDGDSDSDDYNSGGGGDDDSDDGNDYNGACDYCDIEDTYQADY